jgi:hypothetical protein
MFHKLFIKLFDAIPDQKRLLIRSRLFPVWMLPKYFKLYVQHRIPVIIYQMGKVGSTSIARSLQLKGTTVVVQTHWLRKDYQPRKNANYAEILRGRQIQWMHRHIIEHSRKAKFITLVRDPVAVNIGWFFQNLQWIAGLQGDDVEQVPLEKLLDIFYTRHVRQDTKRIINWFDDEFFSALGVDIYRYPFPKEQGFLRIEEGSHEMLIMRLEIDDTIKERCLADFLGDVDFKLVRTNVGSEKYYAETYKAFKDAVIIPPEVLDANYHSRFIQHFYTDEEIKTFRAKWQR